MTSVGLISDTHGFLDEEIIDVLSSCDEIWHAGDLGDIVLIDQLESIAPVRGVYGNIDDHKVRSVWPQNLYFEIDQIKVFMTHIGGYPGRYHSRVRQELEKLRPDLYICGHSHILKIQPDKKLNLLHMNPGACGHHGFHQFRTMITFDLDNQQIINVNVIEFGRRGRTQ